MANDETIKLVRDYIQHGCDGPVNPFTVISRATWVAAKGWVWDGPCHHKIPATDEEVANGLLLALEDLGIEGLE